MKARRTGWNQAVRPHFRGATCAVLCVFVAACSRDKQPEPPRSAPLTHTVREYGVTLTIEVDPPSVALDQDVLLTIRATYPEGATVAFPSIADRLEGLQLMAELESPPTVAPEQQQTREWTGRLTPQPAEPYRIAPMAFRVSPTPDAAAPLPIISPAIRLPSRPLPEPEGDKLQLQPEPAYIMPPPGTLLRWTLYALLVLAILLLLAKLLPRIRRKVQILRMSPRERALHALDQLLAENLHEQGLFKPFYHRITAIIRQYIEKQHGIRAPELTTAEFLDHAIRNPAFAQPVVKRLQQFLEAADLVKFAKYQPTADAVTDAIRTARQYLAEAEGEPPSPREEF